VENAPESLFMVVGFNLNGVGTLVERFSWCNSPRIFSGIVMQVICLCGCCWYYWGVL